MTQQISPTTQFAHWLIQLAIDHDDLVGFMLVGWIVLSVVVTGLNGRYRDYDARPGWARFIIDGLSPFVVNPWRLIAWGAAKIGIQIQVPTISGASIRAAEQKP